MGDRGTSTISTMTASAYLAVLRRRWLTILACLLAGVLVAIAVTRSSPKRYASSTRLFVNIPVAQDVTQALQGVQLSQQLIASYAQIATSQTAESQIAEKLHLGEGPNLSATPVAGTLLVQIQATQSSPQIAQAVAAAAGDELISQITRFEQGKSAPVQARTIDQANFNPTPILPRPKRNLEEGAVLGLILGLALAFVAESIDRTIKEPSELQSLIGAPLLALVPAHRGSIAKNLRLDRSDDGHMSEAFRSLRTSVRFLEVDQPLRTIVITSPSAGEGKSTVAVNLATAMAEAGERVILVDADLRRGGLAERFDLEAEPGLTSVIIGSAPAAQAVRPVATRLALVPSGTFPPNSSELLGSTRAADVFDYLAAHADVVIIDAPPILPVSDAVVLSTQVDAVIVVVKAGRTKHEAAAEAQRRLDVIGANVVGCVFNGVSKRTSYGTYENYRYEGPRRRRSAPSTSDESRNAPGSPAEESGPATRVDAGEPLSVAHPPEGL